MLCTLQPSRQPYNSGQEESDISAVCRHVPLLCDTKTERDGPGDVREVSSHFSKYIGGMHLTEAAAGCGLSHLVLRGVVRHITAEGLGADQTVYPA